MERTFSQAREEKEEIRGPGADYAEEALGCSLRTSWWIFHWLPTLPPTFPLFRACVPFPKTDCHFIAS